jgi:Uma2 family endonuclease
LDEFIEEHDLGFLTGSDGPIFVDESQLRYPDIAYFSWSRFSSRNVPDEAILDMVPDLAIEVISPSNTRKEMERKRREYFAGGCKLAWEVFGDDRRIDVYTDVDQFESRRDGETLDGGAVLPGFRLELKKLFDRASRKG